MPNALPDAAVSRFLEDFGTCKGADSNARIGLCVSGGPDSLALLLLGRAAFADVRAATVDHGLRPAAADEALHVAALCRELDIPHITLKLGPPEQGNLSDWARRERYRALFEWADDAAIATLITAHHADDQLETMIMRLNRGAGVAGLSGIRRAQKGLARPLLGWRKAELEALVAAAGLIPVDDPSNQDDRFDRARLRKALAGADWLDPVAAVKSADALAEAEAALDWTAAAYAGRRTAAKDGIVSFDPRALPAELIRRITLHCMRQINPDAAPRGEDLDRLIRSLGEGRIATLSGVKCAGGAFWLFDLAPPRRKN
jgi:tRNA(Ile)-lysidine synthase